MAGVKIRFLFVGASRAPSLKHVGALIRFYGPWSRNVKYLFNYYGLTPGTRPCKLGHRAPRTPGYFHHCYGDFWNSCWDGPWPVNSTRWRSHFLKSTGDISLRDMCQGEENHSDMQHCYFSKSTGDMGPYINGPTGGGGGGWRGRGRGIPMSRIDFKKQ